MLRMLGADLSQPARDLTLIGIGAFVLAGFFGLIGSFASAIAGLIGLVSLTAFAAGRIALPANRLVTWMSALILLYVLAGFLGLAMHPGDKSNLETALMRCAFLFYLPLVSLLTVLDHTRLLRTIELGAAIGAIATAAYVVFELAFLHDRAWGGAGNPGPFATVLAAQFTVCLLAAFRHAGSRRIILLAGSAAAAFCVIASGMRTALPVLVLLPVGLALSLLFRRPELASTDASPPAPPRNLVLLAGFALVLAIAAASQDRLRELPGELAQISAHGGMNHSLGHRVAIWHYASETLPDSWLTGIGQDAASDGLAAFTRARYGFELNKSHMHNIMLTALLRGGIFDLVANLALLFSPLLLLLAGARSGARAEGLQLIGALFLPYFLMAMLNLAFGHDVLDFYFVFMLAAGSVIAFLPDDPPRYAAT
ncbi:MAG: O-antigen ligase family protein [Nitratireductor sp.]|nr:O-antigen ligase family protein [Nitratireductor sp.]